MKKEIDAKNARAVFTIKGEDIPISLVGVSPNTLMYLAIIGAHELLVKRVNPKQAWADIVNGKLHREKKYPPIIHALQSVYGGALSEAAEFWAGLSADNKLKVRKDKRVKIALLEHSDGELVELSELEE